MGLVFVFLLCLLRFLPTNSVSCRDEQGNPVDWFVGYKLPRSFQYVYLTPGMDKWKLSRFNITNGGMLSNTYNNMFRLKSCPSAAYGMYNDETPTIKHDDNSNICGHLKGAIAFDNSSGFWVIHSVPKLSEDLDHYKFPLSGWIYGQHMLCITLHSAYMLPVVEQLIVSEPNFFSSYISKEWKVKYPRMLALFSGERVSHVTNKISPFETMQSGVKLRHFSKSSKFNNDLYEHLVAPGLGFGLKVETWRHGKSEPSVCNKTVPWVININKLKFENPPVSFNSTKDHAKWATTIQKSTVNDAKDMWACLGDINRMYSQYHRGGGTMCIKNAVIWKAFADLVASVEPCHPDQKNTSQESVDI